MEIQSLLEKLLNINDSTSRCAASAAPTTSVTQSLPGIGTYCMAQEFRRIQGSIISLSQHAELLNSVRDDISEYKSVNRDAVATGESCHSYLRSMM